MPQFIELQANKRSMSTRKLIYGIGVNDADYITDLKIDGYRSKCPYYITWSHMLSRCYSNNYHKKQPTYKNCTVTKEWLIFSNFKGWMKLQKWKGNQLDKDIINPGNKIYSPANCCFINKKLNTLMCDNKANRGKHPIGVSWHKAANKFSVKCSVNGKPKGLGYFNNSKDAAEIYNKFKSNLVIMESNKQSDQRIKNGLLKHAKIILKGGAI